MSMRPAAGTPAPDFSALDLDGQTRTLGQYAGRPLLLQFYRYAGCPMCDLRLHEFARAYPPLGQRGLEVVAFFHSSAEALRRHFARRPMPFPVLGDPRRAIYGRYGVETSLLRLLTSALRPSFYRDWLRSMRHGYWGGFDARMTGMPADFLIGPDQVIRLVHLGRDIGDHMSVAAVAAQLDWMGHD